MKIYLTLGMFGKREKQIGNDTDTVKTVIEQIAFWKSSDKAKRTFKIEPYDRLIFGKDSIAIDFGDYMYFLEISDVNEYLIAQFKGI